MKTLNNDYLKYWRVIRYYIMAKYNLCQNSLDILLFLNSEEYFSRKKFQEFNELLPWDRNRFDKLVADGWIDKFRDGPSQISKVYKLSYKAKRVITSIYKKLNGDEIPMSQCNNTMFAKNVRYTDKVYRNFMKQMNNYIREKKLNPLYDKEL
jgi:hypothetical protein